MPKKLFLSILLISISSLTKAQLKPAFLKNYDSIWVEKTFTSLTLDQKIGQILMPRGNTSGKGYDPEKLKKWVKDYQLGGMVFFAGQPSTQAKIVNELQSLSKVPMLIGMDLEWGLAMRLDSTVRFPYELSLGQMQGGEDLIEKMGTQIAKQCKRLGVHVNYAPVVDINNNPNNPVINFRSFGEDKIAVANKAFAYMKGMQSENILTSAKHFPGHGDTGVDSHHDLPVIPHDKNYLLQNELFPYKFLINNGLSGIMTSHLSVPKLDPTPNLAATFSTKILQDLLRKELGFEGLTFTDAMDMQGAVKYFPNGEALVKAILAGNDILETFEDVPAAVEAIKTALTKKQIPLSVLDERVRKILKAKSWVGLNSYKPIVLENLVEDLNTYESELINTQLAEKLLSLQKNDGMAIPVENLIDTLNIVAIDTPTETFFQQRAKKYGHAKSINISQGESLESAKSKLKNKSKMVLCLHLPNIRPGTNFGLKPENTSIINYILETYKPITVIFGNAYALNKIEKISEAKAILLAGQTGKYTEEAAAMAIYGAIDLNGKLPVTVNKTFKVGNGLIIPAIGRLKYGLPEQEGINSKLLEKNIETIVKQGLDAKAYPGAVVQVNKNGRVIYEKAYGFSTYEDAAIAIKVKRAKPSLNKMDETEAMDYFGQMNPVRNLSSNPQTETLQKGQMSLNHIFDFASVTKISTSALAIMRLQSEGKFSLDKTFGDYLDFTKGTNKENLKFRDMLTHRSGLKAWIPFWMDCVDTTATINAAIKAGKVKQDDFQKILHKQKFFAKLFHKPQDYHYDYKADISKNKELWIKSLSQETITWKPNIFSNIAQTPYTVEVAGGLFMNENYKNTLRKQILDSPVNPTQGYVYSDLHYYLYPDLIQKLSGKTFETYLKETYNKIGAVSLGFNPRKTYNLNQIVPTEKDPLFRKTLLHGYVHDEGAAMHNGISGHAGLFGTANDLSKLLQLYLQKGSYGNVEFIKPEVIQEYTAYQFPLEKNRRGIAFDKLDFDKSIKNGPSMSSKDSYGHSGYTGTFVWVEPTENLSYVFLSNRVYPSRENNQISTLNIRTELGNAILKSKIKWKY